MTNIKLPRTRGNAAFRNDVADKGIYVCVGWGKEKGGWLRASAAAK